MYGKIFKEIFDSSLLDTGWETVYVFMSMIVLADPGGDVDLTVSGLARRIAMPVEHVERAINVLAAPDPLSRSAVEDGRRIVPIGQHRGFRIVNYRDYRFAADREAIQRRWREEKRRERTAGMSKTNPGSVHDDGPVVLECPRSGRQVRGEKNRERDKDYNGQTGDAEGPEWWRSEAEAAKVFDARVWSLVRRRERKKAAFRSFRAEVARHGPKVVDQIEKALRNYAALVADREDRYVAQGGTLLNNWRDYEATPIASPGRKIGPDGLTLSAPDDRKPGPDDPPDDIDARRRWVYLRLRDRVAALGPAGGADWLERFNEAVREWISGSPETRLAKWAKMESEFGKEA
jgi:hypothetical protein